MMFASKNMWKQNSKIIEKSRSSLPIAIHIKGSSELRLPVDDCVETTGLIFEGKGGYLVAGRGGEGGGGHG